MSLRAEAAALSKRPGTQQSRIARLLESLSDDERDEVVALIWDDKHISARAVAEVLNKHFEAEFGEFTNQQIQAHRRGPRP
jgi:hypothetical protein